MKKPEIIKNEIMINGENIKSLEAEADKLLFSAEISAAATISEKIEIRKSIPEENDRKATELYKQAEELKAINAILTENLKAAFADYAATIISEIMQPYAGKQYGEQTQKKIRTAAMEKGISFYFHGYSHGKGYVTVYPIENNVRVYNMPDVEMYATAENETVSNPALFINEKNTIQDFSKITIKNNYKYTENAAGKRDEIQNKFDEFKKLVEAAREAEKALNDLLPGDKRYHIIGNLSPHDKIY